MEERKAYFDLVLCKEVGLTDNEILERGGFTRFVSLGKWDLFYEENFDTIVNNVQTHYKDEDGTKVPFYTVRTNAGRQVSILIKTFSPPFVYLRQIFILKNELVAK